MTTFHQTLSALTDPEGWSSIRLTVTETVTLSLCALVIGMILGGLGV
ncbi:hypothetical protein [Sphingobium baderi]|uniref:Uncharacterized protein n=1 Tax=Sphingobium baderi LL03 TaxID=1114964 RepID=T0HBW0_9SPHN|nr:hypothetical protein [Sphingobium baderi]EQA96824.1 hypothetical protein L485_22340 [Sphingobium baderi LL03]KMS64020.1 hypothetical protein V475_23190 [Sphingobium baderi LL03]